MTWRDIPRLAQLETELFAEHAWSEATWWAELAGRPRRDYLVVGGGPGDGEDHGSDIAGYAGLDHAGEVADIMTVAVVPDRRGEGLGDLLVMELVRRAREGGAGAVLLEVRADNGPALALYARHGFEQVSVRRRYYRRAGQPDVDAYVLRLLLGGGPDE